VAQELPFQPLELQPLLDHLPVMLLQLVAQEVQNHHHLLDDLGTPFEHQKLPSRERRALLLLIF
jgi:hypothetical protein